MTFDQFNFDSNIHKAIKACGYTQPTPVQLRSIPDILNGKDLIASAQTGTGKTAAFVLPALQRLTQTDKIGKPRILILTPTRELATQITDAASRYGKFMQFNIISLVGGMPYHKQLRNLSRNVDIIVATPGRLIDHMENRRLDLSQVQMLVLDEADRMLDMGFIDDVNFIANATPKTRQTLLFSVSVDNGLKNIINKLLKNPIRVDIAQEKMAPSKIKQILYRVNSMQHKSQLLEHLLQTENIFKGIIFTATKKNADLLARDLYRKNFSATALHGDLKQMMRNRIVQEFRSGKIQFIVATDVAARGIDIQDVTHVINFDLPKFREDYVHRIGRTGRAGKSGVAISFVASADFRNLQKIERFINQKIEIKTVAGLEPTHTNDDYNPGKPKSKGGFKQKFKEGFRKEGFKKGGFRTKGFKKEGSRKEGFRTEGFKKEGSRKEGFRTEGFKKEGSRKEGFRTEGFKKERSRKEESKRDGFHNEGFQKERFKKEGFKKKFDSRSSDEKNHYGKKKKKRNKFRQGDDQRNQSSQSKERRHFRTKEQHY